MLLWFVPFFLGTLLSIPIRERSSRETQNTSLSRVSTQTLSMPITNLELRLCVERTLDIFTMTPKVDFIVKLSSQNLIAAIACQITDESSQLDIYAGTASFM
jgi:hypothetical protein